MRSLEKLSATTAIQVVEVALGAIPATLVSLYSVFVFLGASERLLHGDPVGLLLLGWFVLGLAGTTGLWLATFRVGGKRGAVQTTILWFLAGGVVGVAVTIAGLYPTDDMQPFHNASGISFWALLLSGPVMTAIWHFARLHRLAAGLSTLVAPLAAAAYILAAPLYWNTVTIERSIVWECGYGAGCDSGAAAGERYIQYTFVDSTIGYQFPIIDGLLDHLAAQPTATVSVRLDVRTWFGRFRYFSIREMAGLKLDSNVINPNQPEPPFPDPVLDGNAIGDLP